MNTEWTYNGKEWREQPGHEARARAVLAEDAGPLERRLMADALSPRRLVLARRAIGAVAGLGMALSTMGWRSFR